MSDKLNELVAEHVFGWERRKRESDGTVWMVPAGTPTDGSQKKTPIVGVLIPAEPKDHFAPINFAGYNSPPYSTDIARAFEVVAKMRDRGYWMRLQVDCDARAYVSFYAHRSGIEVGQGDGNTPAEAISRAALAALGVEVPAE